MKIVRDEKEIELTFSELMLAYEEYQLNGITTDVKETLEEDCEKMSEKDVEILAKEISRDVVHKLSNMGMLLIQTSLYKIL